MQRLTTCAATAALIFAVAGSAVAAPAKRTAAAPSGPVATQATTPRAAGPTLPPLNHGPPIAGMCIYADDRAIGTSSVGKAAAARMQQLRAQVAAELQAEQTSLQTDASALQAKRSTLSADQFAQQAAPIQQREQAFEQKAQLRQRELEATGAEAVQQIHVRINDILRTVYQSRNCSVLLNGEAVVTGNPAMDVTETVVTQLNGVMPTITFDRKTLPVQAQQ